MTPDELIAALAPSRLPASVLTAGWRELLAAFGLGLLLGLLLAIARILGHLPEALRPAAYGAAPAPDEVTVERIANRQRRAR